MKKKVKVFLCMLMCFCILTTMTTYAEAASKRKITYREQNGTKDIEMVFLEPGQQLDLKFIGASDYMSYDRRWTSSNLEVASVNSAGLITAKNYGQTLIKFNLSTDKYESDGVIVVVGKSDTVEIGFGGEPFRADTLYVMPGETVDFDFYNFYGSNKTTYSYEWTTENKNIATVDKMGVMTAVATGITTISIVIKNNSTGYVYPVKPVEVKVGGNVSPIPTETPTFTPTPKPTSTSTLTPKPTNTSTPSPTNTATPTLTPTSTSTPKPTSTSTPTPTLTNTLTPTATPKPTATPTPSPTPMPLTYKLSFVADDTFKITFNRGAEEVSKSDITIYQGSDPLPIDSVTWSQDKVTAEVKMQDYLWEGTSYKVDIGDTKTKSANITAKFAVPDKAVLSWSSLGVEGKAYAQSDNLNGYPVDVKLGVKLYAGEVDVTNTYLLQGYVEYEMLTDYADYYSFTGDTLVFYNTGKSVRLKAKYSYWGSGKEVELETSVKVISATSAPKYQLVDIVDYTIMDTNQTTKIDWYNPVHEVVALDGKNYTIVALIKDNYGNIYSTHENGVSGNYRNIDDYNYPLIYNVNDQYFYMKDTSTSNFYVDEAGSFMPFKAGNAYVYFKYTDRDGKERSVDNVRVKILPEAKLTEIRLSKSGLSVTSAALPGYESLCSDYLTFEFYDQYGKQFEYNGNLNLTCTDSGVESLMGSNGPAYINDKKIIVNGMDIRQGTSRSSVQFVIKAEDGTAVSRFNVSVLDPALDSSGSIVVNGWTLDNGAVFDGTVTENDTSEKVIPINVYDVSRSNVKVGLKTSGVYLSTNANATYNINNCSEGDIYITVLDPNGKTLVDTSKNKNKPGFRLNESTGMIEIVYAIGTEDNPNFMTSLPSGTYTIKATHITKNDGLRIQTAKKSATITINAKVPTLVYNGTESNSTSLTAGSEAEVKLIVEELFKFKLNGEDVKLTSGMIQKVTFTKSNTSVRINSLTVNVPANGTLEGSVGYVIQMNNINRNISLQGSN